jgi:hypothetical protein
MSSETTAMATPAPRLGEPLPHNLLDDGERLTREQLRELRAVSRPEPRRAAPWTSSRRAGSPAARSRTRTQRAR